VGRPAAGRQQAGRQTVMLWVEVSERVGRPAAGRQQAGRQADRQAGRQTVMFGLRLVSVGVGRGETYRLVDELEQKFRMLNRLICIHACR
jgi:hypothetical protein